jgi:hypothetical protein
MATFEFFLFKIWQLVTSFSSKYGDFRNFWNKKNAFLPFALGFFLVAKIRKLVGKKKKKTLQVLAFSLIFSFPLFCASHISFVRKFHA